MTPELKSKEKNLQDLVQYLISKYGLDKFELRDYWDSDNCAIGLVDRNV